MFLCVVQVLCGRQVFPEEQHDPMPDRLRGGADEGGLRSPGPLTLIWQQGEGGKGVGKERDWRRAYNHTTKSTIASRPAPAPHMYISKQASLGGHTLLYRIAIETSVWQGKALEAYNKLQVWKKLFCPFLCLWLADAASFLLANKCLPQTNFWPTADPSFWKKR